MGLAYGDLKPHNIVLYRDNESKNKSEIIENYNYKIKLIDLGGITILENNLEY
jgi:serine/threonine protein kinase